MLFLLLAAAAPMASPSPAPTTTEAAQPQYVVGKTSMAEVMAKMGKPNSVNTSSSGTMLMYMNTKAHIKGTSFIPVVSLFAGGIKTHYRISTFTFGADGLLREFSINNGDGNCDASIIGVGCH